MRLHRSCIFLFVNIVLAAVAREPYCPPVPSCEERLLERVIRNELKMKTLQEEMGIKLDNAIKTAMKNVSNAVSEMTQKATMTGLQLKKENEILRDQLAIPLIYFNAFGPTDYSLESGQVVVYTGVRANEGNGYDKTTGRFTAPVSGLYLFTVQYHVGPSSSAVLEITHRGTQIQASGLTLGRDNYASSSMQVVIRANTSDQICVKSASWQSSQLHNGGLLNYFTGTLVHV